MTKSILKYLKNVFVSKPVLAKDTELNSLVRADILVQRLIDKKKIPGLAITVLNKGNTIFQKGYGYADLEQKTVIHPQKTIFRIASVSKPIAATALAHMVADKIIDLDASFYDYVPYYPKKKWDFTIRQLASHTAGIRAYQGAEYGLNKPYSIKEGLAIFQDDDLLFEPGTGYQYTSFDWVLISLAMQEVSGIPFQDYVKEKVLEPLGMKNTFAPQCYPERSRGSGDTNDEEVSETVITSGTKRQDAYYNLVAERSRSYSKSRIGFRKAFTVNNFYKLAGGGYLSTSEDIARFGQAYLDKTILNEEMLSQFLTSETINGKPTYYGLGWEVSEDKYGRPYYGHVGNGVGGYSNFFVYPKEKMVFAILVNCTNPKVQEELDEVVNYFFDTFISKLQNSNV